MSGQWSEIQVCGGLELAWSVEWYLQAGDEPKKT